MPKSLRVFSSLIQSDFQESGHGNLEAVILTDGTLQHYYRDLTNKPPLWRPAQIVTTRATGPGSLIMSSFGTGEHRNFEVIVPLDNGRGGSDLWHFFHDNSDPASPWVQTKLVAANVMGPGCIIQSDYDHHGKDANFEVVVPVHNASGGVDLQHFFHDNSDLDSPWVPAQIVARDVAGPGCLAQSDQGDADNGNFEVVVPVHNATGGLDLRHFFHDNSDLAGLWQQAHMITDSCSGGSAIVQSDFSSGEHGNFEVIVEECSSSVVAYRHANVDPDLPWFRHAVVIGEPAPPGLGTPKRVCQLTGEYDRSDWDGTGDPRHALNMTEEVGQFGVRGTDLGSSFEHQGRTYFLFGDTSRKSADYPPAMDSVAYATTRPDYDNGLPLQFLPEPPVVQGGNVSQRELEVPLDGVSDGEWMFVFFSTGLRHVEGYDLMGRSVLARSADGMRFDYLWDFSADKFVNVSVVRGQISSELVRSLGWMVRGTTDVLWLWGSGRYRSSDVYLAVMPFGALTAPGNARPVWTRFFSGRRDAPAWSGREEDATALFCNGSVGELSVRWNPHLSRWLATFNSDNPRGILLHWADQPWGPWSGTPLRLLDPEDAYGHYMHRSWADGGTDHTQDDVLPPFTMRDNEWGGEYGPYQIGHFATDEADGSRIWWTLSTWNPYQAMLMASHIPVSTVT